MFGFRNASMYSMFFPYHTHGVDSLAAISLYELMYAFPILVYFKTHLSDAYNAMQQRILTDVCFSNFSVS